MTAYDDLKSQIVLFAMRSGDTEFEDAVPGFIRLGEAHLNRELALIAQECDETLTGTIGSRLLPLPADFVEPISLHLTTDENYIELRPDQAGEMVLQQTAGWPDAWAINGANIQIDAPCERAHTFSFRYKARFALSDEQPTNWLIESHPDVYLAAALGWGGAFMMDDASLAKWKAIAQEGIDSVSWQASRSRLTTATVDAALLSGGGFNVWTG